MSARVKAIVYWLVIVLSACFLWFFSLVNSGGRPKLPEITYSAFLSQVESGNVKEVGIHKNQVTSRCRDASKCPLGYSMFTANVPTNQDAMLQILRQNKVEIGVASDEEKIDWSTWLLNFSPLIPLAGATLWFFMVPTHQSGAQSVLSIIGRVVLWWLAVWGAIFIGWMALIYLARLWGR